jgi:hypothetical protein
LKFYSHYFTYCEYCSCFGRYPRHDRFNAVYIPNSAKSRSRRSGDGLSNVDTKATPFADNYDGDVHNLVANMRRLDGTLPPHDKYGPPVNLFSPPGTRKYWIRASTPAFGYLSCTTCYNYMLYFSDVMFLSCKRYLFYSVLDKAVCPFLVKTFDMSIWHPTCEKTLDALLDAEVDV